MACLAVKLADHYGSRPRSANNLNKRQCRNEYLQKLNGRKTCRNPRNVIAQREKNTFAMGFQRVEASGG
jgi:hypothetical protein